MIGLSDRESYGSTAALDVAKRFDALDADGKAIITSAIVQEERRAKE